MDLAIFRKDFANKVLKEAESHAMDETPVLV